MPSGAGHVGNAHRTSITLVKVLQSYCIISQLCHYACIGYDENAVGFCKVDVDQLSSLARDFGIRQMPTFVIYSSDKMEIGRVLGWSDFNLINYMKKMGLEQIIPPKPPITSTKSEWCGFDLFIINDVCTYVSPEYANLTCSYNDAYKCIVKM